MNITDMRLAVMLGLDKTSALASPAFEDEEIDYWLNEAQLELVKRKAFGNNARQEGINDSVKRMDDLNPLIKTSLVSYLPSGEYLNVIYVTPPTDYMFYVGGAIRFYNNLSIPTKLIRSDQIHNLVMSRYNNPCLRSVYVYLTENRVNFIYNPDLRLEIVLVNLTYIKIPKKLVAGTPGTNETNVSELPEQTHSEIVALAVNMLLENIESERFQTNQLMYNNKE